jgi:hypothetical protein
VIERYRRRVAEPVVVSPLASARPGPVQALAFERSETVGAVDQLDWGGQGTVHQADQIVLDWMHALKSTEKDRERPGRNGGIGPG